MSKRYDTGKFDFRQKKKAIIGRLKYYAPPPKPYIKIIYELRRRKNVSCVF